MGVVELPSRWVESAIAASIVLAGANNLYPLVSHRLWGVAFAFGLVHGLGFASVLIGLLPPGAPLLTALAGFNLGVEAGQLVLVAAVLLLAFAMRRTWIYRRVVLQAGSLAIAGVAALWLLQRSFGIGIGA